MDLLEKYAYRIRIAMNKTQRNITASMQKHSTLELTLPQFYLLNFLIDEEPCKITYLAKRMEVNPSNISSMINRLVQNGLVSREYSHDDRRNVFVSLTPQGRETLKRDLEVYSQAIKHYLSQLELNELETFTRTFEKLASIDHP